MPGQEKGFERAVTAIVGAFAIVTFIEALSSTELLSPLLASLLKLLISLSTIGTVLNAKYWGTYYLVGWLFGVIVLAGTRLVGILDLAIYLGPFLLVLLKRFERKTGSRPRPSI